MTRALGSWIVATLVAVSLCHAQEKGFTPLFDGRSLQGWEGNETAFRVMDGAIVGGNLEAAISQSEHLCTTREFSDFELLVEGRVEGDPNAGVGFRSQRLPGSNEVAGYQADMGFLSGRGMSVVSDVDDLDLDSSYPLCSPGRLAL